jgi:hypothetical protein
MVLVDFGKVHLETCLCGHPFEQHERRGCAALIPMDEATEFCFCTNYIPWTWLSSEAS